jgi:hypothetical protein
MISDSKEFEQEVEKARASFKEFSELKDLFNEEHYTVVNKRSSAFFESQQIIKQHTSAKLRIDGLFKKLDDIEQENQRTQKNPETRVSELADREKS